MEREVLKVSGMSCAACTARVERSSISFSALQKRNECAEMEGYHSGCLFGSSHILPWCVWRTIVKPCFRCCSYVFELCFCDHECIKTESVSDEAVKNE